MAAELDARIRQSLHAANLAWSDFDAQLRILQSQVQIGRDDEVEPSRQALHDFLDKYVDQYALAGRWARGAQT